MDINKVYQWMEALKTKPQVIGRLHSQDGYCCLGVAEELNHGAETWVEFAEDVYESMFSDSCSDPSNETTKTMGIDQYFIYCENCYKGKASKVDLVDQFEPFHRFLALYNDAGYSFDFIRKLIGTYIVIPYEREHGLLKGKTNAESCR